MGLKDISDSAQETELRPGLDAPAAWVLASSLNVDITKRFECHQKKWSIRLDHNPLDKIPKIILVVRERDWSKEGYRFFFVLDHPKFAYKSIGQESVLKGHEKKRIITLATPPQLTEFAIDNHVCLRLYILVPRCVMEADFSSLLMGMLRTYNRGSPSPSLDLTIRTASGQLKLHSCIFNQVQETDYAEGATIDISDVNIDVLKELVEYCYVREVSRKMVKKYPLETILVAERLKILPLVKAMMRLLPLVVTLTNVIDLIEKSSECSCEIREPIQRYCLGFIRINLKNFNHDTFSRKILILLLNERHPYPQRLQCLDW